MPTSPGRASVPTGTFPITWEGPVPGGPKGYQPRQLRSWQSPAVLDEGNLARLNTLSYGMPTRIALEAEYPVDVVPGYRSAPGEIPLGEWVVMTEWRVCPCTRTPVPAYWLWPGNDPPCPSPRANCGRSYWIQQETGVSTSVLAIGKQFSTLPIYARRASDEARNIELNEGFRAIIGRFGRSPIDILGEDRVRIALQSCRRGSCCPSSR